MKTVKVRIAVVVDKLGQWHATGFCDKSGRPDDASSLDVCYDCIVSDLTKQYWIEADLKVPEYEAIEGIVSEAD